MKLRGKAHKFGDSVNTDYIISGRYKFKIQDPKELAKYLMEDLRPEFYKDIKKGDFIVAGSNFGCGSSREQAPLAIKYAGISAVIAQSFARIFFRNAINLGLLLIECETDGIKEDDLLEANTEAGYLLNMRNSIRKDIKPLPSFMNEIIKDGGVIKHFKKHKGFKF
ncbi:MAG: 3-isopropylmalate dehydratase [Candidatus Omnitrophota bacterium]